MLAQGLHREDIKAVLRKRYGSVRAWAHSRNLKPQAVADFMRGRASQHVADEIEAELQAVDHNDAAPESIKLDNSGASSDAHRLIAGAR